MKEQKDDFIGWSIWAVFVFMCVFGSMIAIDTHKGDIDSGLKEQFEQAPTNVCMINDSTYHVSFGDQACILIENGVGDTRIMYHSQYETLHYVNDSIIVTVTNKDCNVLYAIDADTLVRHKDNVVFKN